MKGAEMPEHKTLFIDIETTGLVPKIEVPGKRPGTTKKEQLPYETGYMQYPYIVSMAWAIDDEEPKYYVLNQEGREIPKEASDIHGITTEIADKSDMTFIEAAYLLLNDAKGSEIVVGHGLYFDTSIIKANFLRHETPESFAYMVLEDVLHKYKRIDTMRSTAKMMRKWPTLSELHLKLFRRGFECHNAKNDLEATRRCYKWLLKKGIVPTFEKLQEKAKEKSASS